MRCKTNEKWLLIAAPQQGRQSITDPHAIWPTCLRPGGEQRDGGQLGELGEPQLRLTPNPRQAVRWRKEHKDE